MAAVMGVDVGRVVGLTFFLGSALGGAAGVLVGLYYTQIDFVMGYSAGLKAFTAAVLGGIGNIRGAMLGGLLLGVIESLAVTFINPAFKDVVAFARADPRPSSSGRRAPRRDAGRLEEGVMVERLRTDYWPRRCCSRSRWSRRCSRPTTTSSACSPASASIRCWRSGLNIVVGFAGLLDIGYVAFFGIGSYIYAFLASPHFGLHLPFVLAMPIVTLVDRHLGHPDRRADAAAARRLPRDRHAGLRRDHLHLPRQPRPADQHHRRPERPHLDRPAVASSATSSSGNIQYYYLFLADARCRAARLGAAARFADRLGVAGDPRGRARGRRPWASTRPSRSCRPSRSAPRFAGFAGGLLASWQRSVFPDNFLFHGIDQHPGHGDPRRHGQRAGRHPRRGHHRGAARDLPRPRALPPARVRRAC